MDPFPLPIFFGNLAKLSIYLDLTWPGNIITMQNWKKNVKKGGGEGGGQKKYEAWVQNGLKY